MRRSNKVFPWVSRFLNTQLALPLSKLECKSSIIIVLCVHFAHVPNQDRGIKTP